MARGRPAFHVHLSSQDQTLLEAVVRQPTSPQREVLRARIALLAHQGKATEAIASELGVSKQTVCKWRQQAALRGKAGLVEGQRPGRPRRISDQTRLERVALACDKAEEDGRATPTLDELVARSKDRGLVEQLSRSHLQRILQDVDLRPHRVTLSNAFGNSWGTTRSW